MSSKEKSKNVENEQEIAALAEKAKNSAVKDKIDFVGFIEVEDANPNGDPMDEGRPRNDGNGFGLISDVCLKRKIRNRLQDLGNSIFVQSRDREDDGFSCLHDRADSVISGCGKKKAALLACDKWIDVRAFGSLMAFKSGKSDSDGNGVSIPVRGAVSLSMAKSVSEIEVADMQITKSVNSENDEKNGSDTMGMRHYVPFGLYKFSGSVNIQLAQKNGLSDADIEQLKEAICTMFENDVSSCRPEGSMRVARLYWFVQKADERKLPKYSPYKVHHSVNAMLKDGVDLPKSICDYEIVYDKLEGLDPEIIE